MKRVVGVDEVGLGCIAGPLVLGLCMAPEGVKWPSRLNDSKKLSKATLLAVDMELRDMANAGEIVIGIHSVPIAVLNAAEGSIHGCWEFAAVKLLTPYLVGSELEYSAIIDGNTVPYALRGRGCRAIVKADSLVKQVSAASVIAKVWRDIHMQKMAKSFPGYDWENNVGYPTPKHLAALKTLGATSYHRKHFAPVRAVLA